MNGALMPLSMNYLNDNSMSIREEQQNTPNKGYIHGVLLGIFTIIVVSLTNMAYHFLIFKSRSQGSDKSDERQQKNQEDVGSVPVQKEIVAGEYPHQVEQERRGVELNQTAAGLFFGMAFSIMANIMCNSLLADSKNVYEKSLGYLFLVVICGFFAYNAFSFLSNRPNLKRMILSLVVILVLMIIMIIFRVWIGVWGCPHG